MTYLDILLLLIVIIILILCFIYFTNSWLQKKYSATNELIEKSKMTADIFVIEKKMMLLKDANMPKEILDRMPKFYKYIKVPIVKAKIGNRIMSLIVHSKKIFKKIIVNKKNKFDMVGIYILGFASNKKK